MSHLTTLVIRADDALDTATRRAALHALLRATEAELARLDQPRPEVPPALPAENSPEPVPRQRYRQLALNLARLWNEPILVVPPHQGHPNGVSPLSLYCCVRESIATDYERRLAVETVRPD